MEQRHSIHVLPIAGMVGYGNGPKRIDLGDVSFVSWDNLSTDWSELGFASNPVENLRQHPFPFDLEPVDVVGVVRSAANLSRDDAKELMLYALRLLIASNSAWAPSAKRSPPLPGLVPGRSTGFVYTDAGRDTGRYSVDGSFVGPLHEVRLDAFWETNQKHGFFTEISRVLSGKTSLDDDWQKRLIDATSLLGHSRLARTDWESFLFSMIGMERLLKKTSQHWHEGVTQGVEDLFSWLREGRGDWYSKEIRALYALRNAVVHGGTIALVNTRSAKIADEVLFNALLMSYKHLNEVRSLDNLIERARQVAADVAKGNAPTALPNATASYSSSY